MGMRNRRIGIRIPVLFALAAAGALLPVPAGAAAGPDAPPPAVSADAYVDRLVEESRRRRLHDDRYWHTLLHYQRTLTGLASLVDDPRFFLAPGGKRDPAAELEATLRAFFRPEIPGEKHPVCRFVARYAWLKEALALDPSRLPAGECLPFARLVADLKPEAMTLVFPAAHMNSPASMFGHTFLSYETASRNRLLSHAVNYSAITTETFGPLFAVKGLVGLYPGYFSVLPYYAKLQEYADIDQRDLWEYPLNFTREETIRSLRHVYELDGIFADYFFFDENCSYVLLFLLEAARPGLDLTGKLPPWVIPLDTIRAVEAAGLIAGATYRPSKTTTIRDLASRLGRSSRLLAREAARGRVAPDRLLAAGETVDETARRLELAVEYLQYLYTRREVERGIYSDRLLALLAARSRLGILPGERTEIDPPPRPETGHRSSRVQIGAGVERAKAFQEIRFRFAYHTLADDDRGYLEGSHIVFADTALRYGFEARELRLERLDLVDIVSLAPRDELFQPISWKITAGATRQVMADGRRHQFTRLVPGAGLAAKLPVLGLCYAMLEAEAGVGAALEAKYALGFGGSLGAVRTVTDRWKLLLSARGMAYGVGDKHSLIEVAMTQNVSLTPNLALSLDLARGKTREFYRTEVKLALNLFF